MSLEAAILENTATLKLLIAALSTAGASAPKSKAAQAAAASGPVTAPVVEVAVPLPTIDESLPVAASAAAASPVSTAATDDPVTYTQVAKAITDGVKTDRERVVSLLTKYNAKRGTDLKTEQYAAFLAELS